MRADKGDLQVAWTPRARNAGNADTPDISREREEYLCAAQDVKRSLAPSPD